jgi:hypothetical protein
MVILVSAVLRFEDATIIKLHVNSCMHANGHGL